MIIYRITNTLNSKIYVGQTVHGLLYRWGQHKRNALNYNIGYPLYRAIRKYGIENFTVELIDLADSVEESNAKEIFWIENLNCYIEDKMGYNLTRGGHNRDNLAGKSWGKHTEEHKNKMSAMFRGVKPSESSIAGSKRENSQATINLTTGMEFSSAREMSKFYGLSYIFTLNLLSGNKRQKNGDIFRYKDDSKAKKADIRESFVPFHKALPKKILCVETNEVFSSIKEASEKLNIGRTGINNMLKGRSRKSGGLTFEYYTKKVQKDNLALDTN